jgi:hypothetical protein
MINDMDAGSMDPRVRATGRSKEGQMQGSTPKLSARIFSMQLEFFFASAVGGLAAAYTQPTSFRRKMASELRHLLHRYKQPASGVLTFLPPQTV